MIPNMSGLQFDGMYLKRDYTTKSRLFWDRVRVQGQELQARAEFDELVRVKTNERVKLGQSPADAKRHASYDALHVVDAKYPENEQLRVENTKLLREMAEAVTSGENKANRQERKRQIKEQKQMADELSRKLDGKPETSIMDDINFARSHIHRIGNPEDKATWTIDPSEAPSASAWNMLMFAADNKKEFMKTVTDMEKEQRKQDFELKKEQIKAARSVDKNAPSGQNSDRMVGVVDEVMADIRSEILESMKAPEDGEGPAD